MVFCGNCGTPIQDGVKFCPKCGKETAGPPAQPVQTAAQAIAVNDAQENKMMAILSYIIFFIPLLTGNHKKSPFVKYHANQGTALAIIAAAYWLVNLILTSIIRVRTDWGFGIYTYHTPFWLSTILWLIGIPVSILCILGIINAAKGETKPLPVIGKFTIIK